MGSAAFSLTLAASAVLVHTSWETPLQGSIDTTEVDGALQRELNAVLAERDPRAQAELAARLGPRLEAEATRGQPRRRASLWLALAELHSLRSRRALAEARTLDAAWVEEREVERDCQVPNDPEDGWARIALMVSRLDTREAAFECAARRSPGNAHFWFGLGEAQAYRLRLSEAVRSFERVVELEGTNEAAFMVVALRGRLGDAEGAIAAADAAHARIQQSPSRPSLIGREGQAALLQIATRLRVGRRAEAAAVWRQNSWLIGRGEFCLAVQDGKIVEVDECEAFSPDFPALGSVQAWGKFATGPLDEALESKCDHGWKVLAAAGPRRVVPRTYWLPEEEGAASAAVAGGGSLWVRKMCSGSNSLAVHLLPAGQPLGADTLAAAAVAPHVLQEFVGNAWLTPNGHKADLRVHVILAASTTSGRCLAEARPLPPGMLGASRIWVSRRGMLRVAPAPHDPSLTTAAALVTSNPLHGRIRDPGATQLWDNLSPEAADALHGRIRAAAGEVVRAAGYEPLGDGGSMAAEASLYCKCEFVPQYALYGLDMIFERGERGLVPWVLEASYAPDMRSDYARNHSAAALHALREALEASAPGVEAPAEVLSPLRERCAKELGCEGEAQISMCADSLLDLQRERRHLSELLRLYHPGSDNVADERLADRLSS